MKKKLDPVPAVRKFVRRCLNHWPEIRRRPHLYVGIDPGAKGAIAIRYGHFYIVVNIPTFQASRGKKHKTVFNYLLIDNIFKILKLLQRKGGYTSYCCIEIAQIFGPGGTYGAFRVGCGYGMWPLYLISKGFSLLEVAPNKWKQAMGLGGQDKDASRFMALNLFPRADIHLKKDHDKAEALLLAEYMRRVRGFGSDNLNRTGKLPKASKVKDKTRKENHHHRRTER